MVAMVDVIREAKDGAEMGMVLMVDVVAKAMRQKKYMVEMGLVAIVDVIREEVWQERHGRNGSGNGCDKKGSVARKTWLKWEWWY